MERKDRRVMKASREGKQLRGKMVAEPVSACGEREMSMERAIRILNPTFNTHLIKF